jgi:ATP-dependent DNA helicase HFM1/MER3
MDAPGVLTTAEQLSISLIEAREKRKALPWSVHGKIEASFHDARLNPLAANGIGVHHAGLSVDDRRLTEELFLRGDLRVVVATSVWATDGDCWFPTKPRSRLSP